MTNWEFCLLKNMCSVSNMRLVMHFVQIQSNKTVELAIETPLKFLLPTKLILHILNGIGSGILSNIKSFIQHYKPSIMQVCGSHFLHLACTHTFLACMHALRARTYRPLPRVVVSHTKGWLRMITSGRSSCPSSLVLAMPSTRAGVRKASESSLSLWRDRMISPLRCRFGIIRLTWRSV